MIDMVTVILVVGGLLMFVLFFKCIDWFEKI